MTLALAAGPAHLQVDPQDGGRLTSLRLHGQELLVDAGPDPVRHGSFVMAPYAGRVRDGRFTFGGREVTLPLTLPPHAGHGLVLDRPWEVRDHTGSAVTLSCAFDGRWPWGGSAVQRIEVSPDGLRQSLTVEADEQPFPASLGWHPWFARRPPGWGPAHVTLQAGAMLERDVHHLATSRRVPPPPPPWDDCFVDVTWPVSLTWPGALQLQVWADTPCVVVYTDGDVSVCVEPQTHPPDALNTGAALVRPGHPLHATTQWRWALSA